MSNKKLFFMTVSFFLFSFFIQFALYANETAIESDRVARMAVLALQLGIIIFVAWVGGRLFHKLNLPSVLGELVAGIVIGPYLLGQIIFPGFPQGIFPLQGNFPVSEELYAITTIASIILLFLVGVETDIDTLFSFSIAGLVVGIFGVVVSFFFGDLVGVLFSGHVFGVQYGFMHPVPLFLGVISTATSVGITARILSEKRKMDSPEGVTIISAAVIDDVLGIITLAIVVSIVKSGHVSWQNISLTSLKAVGIWLGFTAVGLTFSRQLSRFLKRFKDRITISVMSFALALLLAGIFEKSGLAMIIGAYIMGISLSKTDLSFMIRENLSVLHRFLVPIFFCVMGMLVNVKEMFSLNVMGFGMVYLFMAVLGKIIGCGIPPLFLNFNLRGALRIGMGMIPRGEVALIVAGIGLSTGIISHKIFSIAVMMTFITTLISPVILSRLLESDKPVLKKAQAAKKEYKQIKYVLPNPETAELILIKVIADFESEGFYVHCVDALNRLYQIRKNTVFITLKYTTEELVFDCLAENASFIHTLFYEVVAEFEHVIKCLQSLTNKEQIGKKIFAAENGIKKEENGVNKDKINISQVIVPPGVEINLKGATKKEIIEELTDILIKTGQLDRLKREEVLKDLFDRESTLSTGMQDGIAIPHAKTSVVTQLIAAVGLKKEGVNFDSFDKKPSTIFIMTLTPKSYPQPYLEFMARITKFLIDARNRQMLLSCKTNRELFDVLTKLG